MLVKLHLPPPVIATLAKALECDSYILTSVPGQSSLIRCAQKHPAAPAPMIAILLMALCVFIFKGTNMLAELQVYAVFFGYLVN